MIYKNIKKALIIFATVATLQACTKKEVIDLTPEFSLDALSNPSSIKQVEEVLTGAYAGFRNANYYGSGSGTGAGWSLMPDVLSDNLYETANESLANSRVMADWIYDPSTGQALSLYSAPYGVIAAANIVLRDIDKFTTPANQLQANRIKGQAYAIRALAHFDLMRYFANSFDRNSTTELALGYTTEFTVSAELKPSRLSNKEYYDKLFSDINTAITLLGNIDQPINATSGLTRPMIDRNGAYAISARINLYAGNWTDAATAATNALSNRPLATTQAAFSGMYNQTSRGEIIWNVQFEAGQGGPTFLVYFVTSSRSYFRPSFDIAVTAGNSGLLQSNDIRYNAFFSIVNGGLALTKYQGKGTATDGTANFPAIRSGEMYLIRAEANARLGGANEVAALADLNALRAARISGYVPVVLAGPALISAIADERRRELVGEGHRFFDLKRTTRTIQRGAPCGNATLTPSGDCSLVPADREWNLPIHDQIRNANPNLKQNPGYN